MQLELNNLLYSLFAFTIWLQELKCTYYNYLLQIINEQEILNQTYTMTSQYIFDES